MEKVMVATGKYQSAFEKKKERVPFMEQPIVIGIKVMLSSVYVFAWFAAAAAFAWIVSLRAGWYAAMYFVAFVGSLLYAIRCLKHLGMKTKKGRFV